jgi:thiol:disulfide interchange protein DsbD
MERTTFADPVVAREAERFSTLRADVTESTPESDALLGRFEVLGVPTIIFYDAKGVEVDRVVGFVDAGRFTTMLRQIGGPHEPRGDEAQKAAAPATAAGRPS